MPEEGPFRTEACVEACGAGYQKKARQSYAIHTHETPIHLRTQAVGV